MQDEQQQPGRCPSCKAEDDVPFHPLARLTGSGKFLFYEGGKNMTKLFAKILSLTLALLMLVGCASTPATVPSTEPTDEEVVFTEIKDASWEDADNNGSFDRKPILTSKHGTFYETTNEFAKDCSLAFIPEFDSFDNFIAVASLVCRSTLLGFKTVAIPLVSWMEAYSYHIILEVRIDKVLWQKASNEFKDNDVITIRMPVSKPSCDTVFGWQAGQQLIQILAYTIDEKYVPFSKMDIQPHQGYIEITKAGNYVFDPIFKEIPVEKKEKVTSTNHGDFTTYSTSDSQFEQKLVTMIQESLNRKES